MTLQNVLLIYRAHHVNIYTIVNTEMMSNPKKNQILHTITHY